MGATAASLIAAGAGTALLALFRRRQKLARQRAPRAPSGSPFPGSAGWRGASLIPVQGTVAAAPVPVDTQLTIGTEGAGPRCLMVTDPSVSRRHCRIVETPQGLRLEDLGSRNGTFVNGQRLSASQLLRDGDLIAIGSLTRFQVVLKRPATGR